MLSWFVWICSGFCCSHAAGLWALRAAGRSWRITPVGTFEGHIQGRQGEAFELGRGRSESGVLSPGTTAHKGEKQQSEPIQIKFPWRKRHSRWKSNSLSVVVCTDSTTQQSRTFYLALTLASSCVTQVTLHWSLAGVPNFPVLFTSSDH